MRLRACVGVTTNQLHTDQKTNGIVEKAVRRVEEGCISASFGSFKEMVGRSNGMLL